MALLISMELNPTSSIPVTEKASHIHNLPSNVIICRNANDQDHNGWYLAFVPRFLQWLIIGSWEAKSLRWRYLYMWKESD